MLAAILGDVLRHRAVHLPFGCGGSRRVSHHWVDLETLGPQINTAANETAPTLRMAGFNLFFNTTNPNGEPALHTAMSKRVVRGYDYGQMPDRVEELNARLSQLANNKRDADAAMKQLALLDQTLEDVEGRMENLNQAREWLARTETRLEEVQQNAEEQVKLLGAILKQEKGGKSGEGAPAMTTRDTVIKLARQSWNVDEIARATSLSRGEVELILELSAK